MNKYLKIGLIAIPCGLVVWLLYKTAKGFSKNAIAKDEKIKNQQAETEVDKIRNEANEGYIAKGQQEQQAKNKQLAEVQKSKGFATREEYVQYLRENEQSLKKEYGSGVADHYLRNIEIHVSEYGVDPGNISYDALQERIDMLQDWKKQAAEYRRLTGEQVSISNSNFDTVEEMEAAVISAKAEIAKAKEEREQHFKDEYAIFSKDNEIGVGCGELSYDLTRRYLANPSDYQTLQLSLTGIYNKWQLESVPNAESIYSKLYDLAKYENYIVGKKKKDGAWRNVYYVADACALLKSYKALSVSQKIYIDTRIADNMNKGNRAFANIHFKKEDHGKGVTNKYARNCFSLYDFANCVQQLGFSGVSKNDCYAKEWKQLMNEAKPYSGRTVDKFGFEKSDYGIFLQDYAMASYGISSSDIASVNGGMKRVDQLIHVE